MLYIVSTPIGNLSDITFRAIEALKNCDYILCEDTRHSLILLKHYHIFKPLKSYHKFNESASLEEIISNLKQGLNLCLISDAGTPGISDPGTQLVQACVNNNIPVTPLPGPCAAISALSCSGLTTDRFQFWGFLPRKQGELKRALQEILAYPATTICYEAANRLLEVLRLLHLFAPARDLVVARELTKKFEDFRRGCAKDLLEHWQSISIKGEIVLMIAGNSGSSSTDWQELSPEEHVELVQTTYSINRKEAIQIVAKLRAASKREIYNLMHRKDSF